MEAKMLLLFTLLTLGVLWLSFTIATQGGPRYTMLTNRDKITVAGKEYQIPIRTSTNKIPSVDEGTMANMRFLWRDWMIVATKQGVKPFVMRDTLLHVMQWEYFPPWMTKMHIGIHSDYWQYVSSPEFASLLNQRGLEIHKEAYGSLKVVRRNHDDCEIRIEQVVEKTGVTQIVYELQDEATRFVEEEYWCPISPLVTKEFDGVPMILPNNADFLVDYHYGKNWRSSIHIPSVERSKVDILKTRVSKLFNDEQWTKVPLSKWRSPAKWVRQDIEVHA